MEVIALDSVGSTMDEARSRLGAGRALPFAVVAREQTGGRGRRNAPWASPPGGVWLTAAIAEPPPPLSPHSPPPPSPPSPPPLFALLAPLAVREAIARTCEVETHRLLIKWPNDVLLDEKKISGVLCERPRKGTLLVGIGINADFGEALLPNDLAMPATTLRSALGHSAAASALVDAVLGALAVGRTIDELNAVLAYRGRRVRTTTPGGGVVEGEVLGVAADGALRVRTAHGEQRITSGAIGRVRVVEGS